VSRLEKVDLFLELAGACCVMVAAFMVTVELGLLALGVGLVALGNRPRSS